MKFPEMLVPPPLRKPRAPGAGNGQGQAPANLKDEPPEVKPDHERHLDRAKEAPADMLAWVDTRTGGSSFLTGMLYRKVPKGTNWFYTLGSATPFAFTFPALTRVFPAMYYTPSPTPADGSVTPPTNHGRVGGVVRGHAQ